MLDRDIVKTQLIEAANNTHEKYPRFQGVCIYGSFASGKDNPRDVDLIPVFDNYSQDWSDLFVVGKAEEYFESHFEELPKEKWIKRRDGGVNKRLTQFGHGITYLSDEDHLFSKLISLGVVSENFVGIEAAHEVIRDVLHQRGSFAR